MTNYFEVKARYERHTDDGSLKRITESYVVEAISFAEAETRVIEELSPIFGDVDIRAVKRIPVSELHLSAGEKFFLATVMFFSINEKIGAEKKTKFSMLIEGSSYDDALMYFKDIMKDSASNYELVTLSETAIVDVFRKNRKIV